MVRSILVLGGDCSDETDIRAPLRVWTLCRTSVQQEPKLIVVLKTKRVPFSSASYLLLARGMNSGVIADDTFQFALES